MAGSGLRGAALAPLLISLSACGGGGGDSGGGAPPVVVAPTPAPTPAPAPTPTPALQYADPFAFDRERFFESALVEVRYEEVYDDNSPRSYSFVGATGRINEAHGAAVLTWHPEKSGSVRFDNVTTSYVSEELGWQDADGFRFRRVMPQEYRIYSWGRADRMQNVAVVSQERWQVFRLDNGPLRTMETAQYFLAGQRTPEEDMPAPGIYSYNGSSGSGRTEPVGQEKGNQWYLSGQQSLSIDLTRRAVTGSWLAPNGLRFELNGAVQGGNNLRMNGSMVAADGSLTGRFIGFFYGPKASEVGILYLLQRDNFATQGFFVGARR